MSSGAYDGLRPSSSYGHGDSWRPSGSVSSYDRPSYHPRRRSVSPSRRYVSYDAYYTHENNYRPNYRPEEGNNYRSRSPSPDHYSRAYTRISGPDKWARPPSWANDSASWEQSSVALTSPISSTVKGRRDSMLATRMFEPSDSWKQNHVDRPLRVDTARSVSLNRHPHDSPLPHTPDTYLLSPNTSAATNTHGSALWSGDFYPPVSAYREGWDFGPHADSYRPGWSPSSPTGKDARRRTTNFTSKGGNSYRPTRRPTSRYDDSTRRVSDSTSLIGSGSPRLSPTNRHGLVKGKHSRSRSHRSSSRSRRSYTRSSSRESQNDRRSVSRGRRSQIQGRSGSKHTSANSQKNASPVKYTWDRSTAAPGMLPTSVRTRDLPPQKNSGTRASSRSSIASSRASNKSPPPVPQPQPVDPADATHVTDQEVVTSDDPAPHPILQHNEISEADVRGSTHVEDLPPRSPTPPTSQPQGASADDSAEDEVHSPQPLSTPPVPRQPAFNGTSGALVPADPGSLDKVNGISESLLQGGDTMSPVPGFEFDGQRDDPAKVDALVDTDNSAQLTGSQTLQITRGPSPVDEVTVKVQSDRSSMQDRAILESEPHPPDAASDPSPVFPPTSPPSPLQESLSVVHLLEGIPTEAKSFREALRIVVMTRVLCDRQTREERTNPVLLANLSIAAQSSTGRLSTSPDETIKDVLGSERHRRSVEEFVLMKTYLRDHFEKHQEMLTEKVQRLQDEYLVLQERWLAHCASLDEQSKPTTVETDPVPSSGRTTRRSVAGLGDAVRSDLEMEQIIASLGNDDLTDPNHLSLRNLAIVPDMISVTSSKVGYCFDDTNHLVRNPLEYYGPQTGIHDWTEWEKEVFLDKFAAQPKQFGVIAEHLPNKTAAQCVDYYYLHKRKFIDFRKVISQYAPNKRKRRGTGKKRGNGLLADIRQHDAEVHGDVDLSKSAARPSRNRRRMAPPELREPKRAPNSRRRNQLDLSPSGGSATPTPEPEARRRARRSNVATSSRTVSVSLEEAEQEVPEEAERPAKRAKRSRKVKSAAFVIEEPIVQEVRFPEFEEAISRRKSGSTLNHWSDEDKKLFLALLSQHGDDFKRIAASMPNKTTVQVSNYFKANIEEFEKVAAMAPKRSPTPYGMDIRRDMTPPPSISIPEVPNSVPTPDLMLAPTPNSHHSYPSMNGNNTRYYESPRHEIELASAWAPIRRNAHEPIDPGPMFHRSPGRNQGHTYPPSPNRPPATYVRHTMPTTYPPPPPSPSVPYTYPPYSNSHSHYPQYEPPMAPQPQSLRALHHPYPLPDPLRSSSRRLLTTIPPIRSRENPYPILPAPYHYSLEHS